jgi:hypothetical protein
VLESARIEPATSRSILQIVAQLNTTNVLVASILQGNAPNISKIFTNTELVRHLKGVGLTADEIARFETAASLYTTPETAASKKDSGGGGGGSGGAAAAVIIVLLLVGAGVGLAARNGNIPSCFDRQNDKHGDTSRHLTHPGQVPHKVRYEENPAMTFNNPAAMDMEI